MGYLISFMVLSVPVYLVLQVIVARRETGRYRQWALLPAPVMAAMALVSLISLLLGSPGWSLWLLLTAPLAFLYLVGFMLVAIGRYRDEEEIRR
jgi:hypothetical protein